LGGVGAVKPIVVPLLRKTDMNKVANSHEREHRIPVYFLVLSIDQICPLAVLGVVMLKV
jgi:hypothetical protein